MNIEIIIDKNYTKPKVVIYTDKIDESVLSIKNLVTNITSKNLTAYKEGKLYVLNQYEIETIYSENGKIYLRNNNEIYTIKSRLYELESLLDKKVFFRISNSEIINFNMVQNIDFKIIGTLVIKFKSGNTSYASRRYIPKIKEFLNI